ncbi:MAG: hypothetical protein KatS3mg055_1496 [Chloroflexus sp.]|jgi:hypothetical protein|uniref:DUF5995 family protein n=1 Tax=Chloroflexus sp. TaxID=1904827 RepID=UPI0021DE88FC|nr:DUF5995 family protein [Chloroflexus sp.]GIV88978.1 MAG: hypothetical protein KatS3mg055_1496 [Chloroflexus sp.]
MPALTERMLSLVNRWNTAGDRRAIFLACYYRMTEHMLSAVERGEFHDSAWVNQLIGDFADYYFVALTAWEQGTGGPLVWQHTFACAARRDTAIVQHLLLGVNAHINYDLVLVLDDLLRPEWPHLAEYERQQRRSDYDKVNQVIALTIDRVQDEVIAPYAHAMRILDRAFGPLDEWCTAHLIRNWRNDVWQQAMQMIATNGDTERTAARQHIDHLATQRARLLSGDTLGARVFGYPLRWLNRLRLI